MYLWESPVCAPEWDLKRKMHLDCGLKEFIFMLCSLRRLSAKELILLNYGSGEDSWESFGLRGDQTSQSVDSGKPSWFRKSTLKNHWKDWCWSWNSNTLATWYKESTHWKRPWCWERLRAAGEGDSRGWDGWMAHQSNGLNLSKLQEMVMDMEAGVLQSTGSKRVRHNWVTEQQQSMAMREKLEEDNG